MTGIAFHYDTPATEPPQALLLAVSQRLSANEGRWSWDELTACIEQTFDLARLRAVEPDHLRETALDGLLPATLAPEAPVPVTISTSWLSSVSSVLATEQAAIASLLKS